MVEFRELFADRLNRAAHIGPNDDVERLLGLGVETRLEAFERDVRLAAAQLALMNDLCPLFGDLTGDGDVVENNETAPRPRCHIESENADRRTRRRFGQFPRWVERIEHRADLSVGVPAEDDIAVVQCPVLNQKGAENPLARLERGFDRHAHRGTVGPRFQLVQFGDHQKGLHQGVDPLAGHGARFNDFDVAPPFARHQVVRGELLHHAVAADPRKVHLVQSDDNRNSRGLGVADRLFGLGHHPVVGGDDQHRDIGTVRPAGAHLGERLVTRSVDEGNVPLRGLDPVGADMLGDAALFAGNDVHVEDPVEERGLPMVDVAQEGDDRRPGLKRLGRIDLIDHRVDKLLFQRLFFFDDRFQFKRFDQQFGGLAVHRLVDHQHVAEFHQLFDDGGGLNAGSLGKILDGARKLNDDIPFPRKGRRLRLGALFPMLTLIRTVRVVVVHPGEIVCVAPLAGVRRSLFGALFSLALLSALFGGVPQFVDLIVDRTDELAPFGTGSSGLFAVGFPEKTGQRRD